jgi:hypothetical protein
MSGKHGEITCRELVELVTEYLEERLAAAERDRFDEHLGSCAGCATYLDQIRATLRLAGRLGEEHIEPPARDALLRAFRGWKRDRT